MPLSVERTAHSLLMRRLNPIGVGHLLQEVGTFQCGTIKEPHGEKQAAILNSQLQTTSSPLDFSTLREKLADTRNS